MEAVFVNILKLKKVIATTETSTFNILSQCQYFIQVFMLNQFQENIIKSNNYGRYQNRATPNYLIMNMFLLLSGRNDVSWHGQVYVNLKMHHLFPLLSSLRHFELNEMEKRRVGVTQVN